MPGIREKRWLPYSQEQMFDLVADVGSYGEFLPWVVATRVRSDSETEMTAETAPEIEVDEPARRGGFARGFGFVVLIVVVLIVVYANEGTIVSAVPTLEPGVSAYTDQVDKLRIWLDARLSGFIPE